MSVLLKIKCKLQLANNMGVRYVLYRIQHILKTKCGFLKKSHPTNLNFKEYISVSDWRNLSNNFLIESKLDLKIKKNEDSELKKYVDKVLEGDYCFFNSEWLHLGSQYDWVTNPITQYKYDKNLHWSNIEDISKEAGDIKFVWEKSRFTHFLYLIRYDYNFNIDLSETIFQEIESWIDHNPINCGPNWKCSQEIALRMFNWYFAIKYYQHSEAFTEERWKKIQEVIYASLHHVYHHINFSRIAVRNNHAITETLFLTLSNIMYPFISETYRWSKEGKKWFEEEIKYQIYKDGTFLQFSMNYHRVVIQLLNLGISVFHKNNLTFSDVVYDRAYKSLDFLFQCMQDENGRVPNYGSNDGALFFPLSNSDYLDYRPQLNALHYTLTGMYLNDSFNQEESLWSGSYSIRKYNKLSKKEGISRFDIGGFYLCRYGETLTFIRCGNHKDRPAQADNLHLDLWYKGINILRDSGSYKYNTTKDKLAYFMGTKSHNTVMVDEYSQMLKGERFIWYFWTQKSHVDFIEDKDCFLFEGSITAFRYLNKKAKHTRKVKVFKKTLKWEVTDIVENLDNFQKKQIWHTKSDDIVVTSIGSEKEFFESFYSEYYGSYKKSQSFYFKFKGSIKTILEVKN